MTGGQTQLDGQRAARALLQEGVVPTASSAYNDDTAVAAMGVLAQQGIDVPGQLSVVGWDDSEAAALSPVGLTSVAQQPFELARLAVERIIARIERRTGRGPRDRSRARTEGPIEHRGRARNYVLT